MTCCGEQRGLLRKLKASTSTSWKSNSSGAYCMWNGSTGANQPGSSWGHHSEQFNFHFLAWPSFSIKANLTLAASDTVTQWSCWSFFSLHFSADSVKQQRESDATRAKVNKSLCSVMILRDNIDKMARASLFVFGPNIITCRQIRKRCQLKCSVLDK